jgi:hypothetical protein
MYLLHEAARFITSLSKEMSFKVVILQSSVVTNGVLFPVMEFPRSLLGFITAEPGECGCSFVAVNQ